MLKILFVSNLFPDQSEPYRGLDNANLLHRLAEHAEIRVIAPRPTLPLAWHPRICRSGDEVFKPVYPAARYVPKIGSLVNHRLMAAALRPALRGWKFHVVLASWLYPDAAAARILAAKAGVPFLAIAQGSDAHQYLKNWVRRRIIVGSLQDASAVVTRSAALSELLAEAGVAREKLNTIYNGVDTTIFHPGSRAVARVELGLPLESRLILYVGNYLPIKNPLLLSRAVRTMPDTLAVMIGSGPLARKISAIGGDRVLLQGRKSPGEIARYMQAADVLCIPSRNEGVPNVLLEALACGLPVVAARVGGIPEIVTDDYLGRLVPEQKESLLAIALNDVLSQPSDTLRIAEHGRAFNWEATTAAYLALLQQSL